MGIVNILCIRDRFATDKQESLDCFSYAFINQGEYRKADIVRKRNSKGQFLKTEKVICEVENCENIVRSLGYCNRHYLQMRRHGEILERTQQDPNEFVIEGDICIIKLYDRHGDEKAETIIDVEDYDKVKDYKWRICTNGYVYGKFLLSRFIMDNPNCIVDHKNMNPLDNRKNNLRLCSKSQNTAYQKIRKNNTTGYKGVAFNKKAKKYEAYLNFKNQRYYLGLFDSADEASFAYNKAAKKYHKEFAVFNTDGSLTEYSK